MNEIGKILLAARQTDDWSMYDWDLWDEINSTVGDIEWRIYD